jgi:protein-disulfide isomerase
MRTRFIAATVVAAIALFAGSGSAQAPAPSSEELRALRQELEAIKRGQDQLRRDVQEIKTILQGSRAAAAPPAQPQNVVLGLAGEPTKGDANARVVLVEFTDYQCPFCGRHVRDALPQIEAEYVKTGKLRYVTREFPLESIHPQAFKAAEAALCAGDQGKYWEMHDRLFANQAKLQVPDLKEHAAALGLDAAAFGQCLDSSRHTADVQKDLEAGAGYGVSGTPSFFINGRPLVGAQPFEGFAQVIDDELERKGVPGPPAKPPAASPSPAAKTPEGK